MASLKKCIEAKCKDCSYDHLAPGSWRFQTEMCNVRSCPLWEVRPITMETLNARRAGKADPVLDIDKLIGELDDEEDEGAPESVAT